MIVALDTTPAAKIRPGSAEHDEVVARHAAGDPYVLTSAVVYELMHGMERRRGEAGWDVQRRYLESLLDGGLLRILPFDGRAARVAGRLRAMVPLPPVNPSSKATSKSKADRRVAWSTDLQTAATVFVAGATLASDDVHHAAIAGLLASFAGTAHPVVGAPF